MKPLEDLGELQQIAFDNACIRCQYCLDKKCWASADCFWFDKAKKLKAIEIIKEKGCLQFCMLGISLEDYNHCVDTANRDYGFERYKHYNQDEFDLLKEVLK